jgi:hypothetical protein
MASQRTARAERAEARQVLRDVLAGKGGDHFDRAADLARDVGAVGLIVCVNGRELSHM